MQSRRRCNTLMTRLGTSLPECPACGCQHLTHPLMQRHPAMSAGVKGLGSMRVPGASVLVIGDAMLDIYCEGGVARVSPEAPVPVVLLARERAVAGGAANVAANIAALGGTADLISILGDDSAAATLAAIMAREFPAVGMDGCLTDPTRPTITKTRVIGNNHQVVRLDREHAGFVAPATEAQILARFTARLPAADIVVLSDYSKGSCTDAVIRAVIEGAAAAGKPVLVDPTRDDLAVYAGASIIKPNAGRLSAAVGFSCATDAEVVAGARAISALTGADLIVTRSEKGMSYVPATGEAIHVPTAARRVYDVSGAGDTVIAALSLAIAAGWPMPQVLAYANTAASIVVGLAGTATVSAAAVAREFARARQAERHSAGKLADRATARAIREGWRAEGLVVGLTNGCFDLLHPGHVALLEQAAGQCDRLIVALNTDTSVARLKGPTRPIQSEQDRARVMAALGAVDLVVLFDEDTPRELVAELLPDVLVKGADYTLEQVVGATEVMAAGGRVHLAELVAGKSTSALVRRM